MRRWIYHQTEPPSDRALRGTIERDVLRELARQLIRREEYSLGAKSVVMPYASENSSRKTADCRGLAGSSSSVAQ